MTATPAAQDQTAILVQLCTKILKEVAPQGMTTKELAAALDKEVAPGFDGISSSILSSKLNAVFRRCHGDAVKPTRKQLEELPITRCQSSEMPRRLVYRHSPPESVLPTPKTTTTSRSSQTSSSPEGPGVEARRKSSSSHSRDDELSSNISGDDDEQPAEPLTPREDDSMSENTPGSWTSSKKRRISASSPSVSSVPRPRTPPDSHYPRKQASTSRVNQPKFNLYYDVVTYDAFVKTFSPSMATALSSSSPTKDAPELTTPTESRFDESETWDIESPEELALNDLDNFVC